MSERLPAGNITLQEIAAAYPALALAADSALRLPPVDPETAEWCDGPALAKWLVSRGMVYKDLSSTAQRYISRWRGGEAARLPIIDRVLTEMDLHLPEIPDCLWIRKPRRSGHVSPEIEQAVKRRAKAGESHQDLADEFGISIRVVRKWMTGR